LILSLLISEVSIFNFAFKSYASLFKSYVKWFFIINLFLVAIDISLPACCYVLFYSYYISVTPSFLFLSNTMTGNSKKRKKQ
jgi:hypothetical protein